MGSPPPTPISIKLYYNGETRKFSLALKDLAVGTFGEKVRFLSLPFPYLTWVIVIFTLPGHRELIKADYRSLPARHDS